MYRRIKTLLTLKCLDRLLFCEAFILTGVARAAVLYVKFDRLKNYMGKHNSESPIEVDLGTYNIAIRVREAVLRASSHTPWESKCLVQALTVQRMLKWKRISSTIYLGVNKSNNNNLQAHAWSRVGELIVTGGEVRDSFTQVSKFST